MRNTHACTNNHELVNTPSSNNDNAPLPTNAKPAADITISCLCRSANVGTTRTAGTATNFRPSVTTRNMAAISAPPFLDCPCTHTHPCLSVQLHEYKCYVAFFLHPSSLSQNRHRGLTSCAYAHAKLQQAALTTTNIQRPSIRHPTSVHPDITFNTRDERERTVRKGQPTIDIHITTFTPSYEQL